MGVSTNGILTYGINLNPDGDEETIKLPWNADEDEENLNEPYQDDYYVEDKDFETWWLNQNGVSARALWEEFYAWKREWQTGDYDHDNKAVEVYEELHPEWEEALNKYYDEKRMIEAQCPVELVTHCSCEYSMYFLSVKGTTKTAYRGTPESITELSFDPNAEIEARQFCQKYGIEWTPQWYLASLWC